MDVYYNTDVHTVLVVCNTRMMLKCMQYDYRMSTLVEILNRIL